MNDRHYHALLLAVIGDAFAAPFDGLGKRHLHAVFKSVDGYIDPSPALKGKLESWKKPALYSSVGQMACLVGLLLPRRPADSRIRDRLASVIGKMPDNGENDNSIFRDPGSAERRFIRTSRSSGPAESFQNPIPCARTLALAIPCSISDMPGIELEAIGLIHALTRDTSSVAGALILLLLLRELYAEPSRIGAENLMQRATNAAANAEEAALSISSRIFESGCNPESLIQSIGRYRSLFRELDASPDKNAAEKIICSAASTLLPGPVTRATINHPMIILPYAVALLREHSVRPESFLNDIIMEGGSVSILAALTGAMAGAIWGNEAVHEKLLNGLVNRHRIQQLAEQIACKKQKGLTVDEYVASELALTKKEADERNAKLKHVKKKPGKEKPRKRKDEELTRHVVESWTKIDKARWKKEKSKRHD